jgi:hypothetical protein
MCPAPDRLRVLGGDPRFAHGSRVGEIAAADRHQASDPPPRLRIAFVLAAVGVAGYAARLISAELRQVRISATRPDVPGYRRDEFGETWTDKPCRTAGASSSLAPFPLTPMPAAGSSSARPRRPECRSTMCTRSRKPGTRARPPGLYGDASSSQRPDRRPAGRRRTTGRIPRTTTGQVNGCRSTATTDAPTSCDTSRSPATTRCRSADRDAAQAITRTCPSQASSGAQESAAWRWAGPAAS